MSELKQNRYKVSVMMPAGNGDCSYESIVYAHNVVIDGEVVALTLNEEVVASYPSRYTIIEKIK